METAPRSDPVRSARESTGSALMTAAAPTDRAVAQRILVGVNGSRSSGRAAAWARAYADRTRCGVIAVHVLTYSREFVTDLPPIGLTSWRRRLLTELRSCWTEPLQHADIPVQCRIVEDDSVAHGLLASADSERVGLIVLGSERQRDFGRLLGSLSYKVSHAARQPVVVVPATWGCSQS